MEDGFKQSFLGPSSYCEGASRFTTKTDVPITSQAYLHDTVTKSHAMEARGTKSFEESRKRVSYERSGKRPEMDSDGATLIGHLSVVGSSHASQVPNKQRDSPAGGSAALTTDGLTFSSGHSPFWASPSSKYPNVQSDPAENCVSQQYAGGFALGFCQSHINGQEHSSSNHMRFEDDVHSSSASFMETSAGIGAHIEKMR